MRISFFSILVACIGWISAYSEEPDLQDELGEEFQTIIYYLDDEAMQLKYAVRELVQTSSDTNRVKQVIEWLSIDPEEEHLYRIWPETIFLRDVFVVDNQTIVVDILMDSLDGFSAGVLLEGLLIHSMVNSILESFPWYKEVWILLDGRVQETFLGHIDIEKPLHINKSLTVEPKEGEKEAGAGPPRLMQSP